MSRLEQHEQRFRDGFFSFTVQNNHHRKSPRRSATTTTTDFITGFHGWSTRLVHK
ncbi:unnamed protein product [Rhodiola kirilowii]